MLYKFILTTLLIIAQTAYASVDRILSVEEAVKIVIKNHPLINSSNAIVDEARGELLSSISPEPPTVAWEYEGAPSGSQLSDYEEKRLTFSQEFEFPVKTFLRYKQGKAVWNRSLHEQSSIRLDLEAQIRERYIEAWEKAEIESILSQNFKAVSEYANNIQKTHELGEASLFDAQRAKVEALTARQSYESAKVEKTVALDNLIRFAGIDSDAFVLQNPLEGEPPIDMDTAYPSDAETNPELKLAEYESIIAGYEKKLAYMSWIPDFEVTYFQQNIPVENDPDFWGMEFGINIPLWFWLGQRGEMKSAKARKQISEADYRNIMVETANEYNTALSELKILTKNYQLATSEILPLSEKNTELAMKSYSVGEASYLEVIEAQRSSLDARLDTIEIAASLYRSIIALDRISGKSILNRP